MIYASSFPSGHSMLSAVVYLTGGALLAVAHAARRVRLYLIGCSILATPLVGVSRVYLGVHWPGDVLAGWAAGAAWAAAAGSWLGVPGTGSNRARDDLKSGRWVDSVFISSVPLCTRAG